MSSFHKDRLSTCLSRIGVSKLKPVGQIKLVAYFCTSKLRMVFIFLKVCLKNQERRMCEISDKDYICSLRCFLFRSLQKKFADPWLDCS